MNKGCFYLNVTIADGMLPQHASRQNSSELSTKNQAQKTFKRNHFTILLPHNPSRR